MEYLRSTIDEDSTWNENIDVVVMESSVFTESISHREA
jgi:hypothetical protein